ncbi:nuclear pore complex protein DDB_G0274915-like [Agrilus planipennis]|uniref:Nuclear pore complex protein DDB_G0274915-like n=1 Tax=Agrilus planipennis TaxID=224129 RepID=A0A1W4WPX8_AGRPL|nr:nuclear pore complex protein DDB_G0274915-like [Agrilus planipennis]
MSTIMKFFTLLLTTCLCVVKGQIFGQPFLPYGNGYVNPNFGHNIFPRPSYPSLPPRVINPFSVPRYSLPYTPSPYVPQYFPFYYPAIPAYYPDGSQFGAGKFPVTPADASQPTTAVSTPAGSPSTTTTKPAIISGSSTTHNPSTSVTELPVTGDEDTVSVEAAP